MEMTSYGKLGDTPVLFDPVSANVNVFYDDSNKQVVVVRSNGAGGIIVVEQSGSSTSYRVEDRGEFAAVRFSPSKTTLAIQRAPNALDFVNFIEGKDSIPYCQTCKGKTTKINDFFWVSENEIIFVTDMGIEFYEVNPDRKIVKCTKTISVGNVNWAIWHADSQALVISTGAYGNIIYPYQYQNGTLFKFNKLEVDLAFYPADPKVTLLQRDVILGTLYKKLYVLVVKQDSRAVQTAEISMFRLHKDISPVKSHSLKLNTNGNFQINIIDNVILVHHLQSKTTLLYDLKFSTLMEHNVKIHQQPLVSPLPLQPKMMRSHGNPLLTAGIPQTYEMYSSGWIVFQPNIIIDAVNGYMWNVGIDLKAFPLMIGDRTLLIEFLLLRQGAKPIILEAMKEMMLPKSVSTLTKIGEVFDRINQVYASSEDEKAEYDIISFDAPSSSDAVVIIQQDDLYTNIFCPVLSDDQHVHAKPTFPISVLIEYITSLQKYKLSVHFYLYEMLVNMLVKNKRMYQLHQFLQYHVLTDSKPLACLLLSIQQVYPAAFQIALDMLKRLEAHEQIVEVFLSKHQILSAIRYLRTVGLSDELKPRKFLHVAKDSGDPDLFYITYKFFEDQNVTKRMTAKFAPSDHCEEFVEYFETLFEIRTS